MTTAKWLDYGRTLTKALIKYQEIISLSSANMINILTTFGAILSYTDLLILSISGSPYSSAVLEVGEVRRLAQDTITRATNLRDLMLPLGLKTQRGLSEVKEMMTTLTAGAPLSPGASQVFLQKLRKVEAIIEPIKEQAEYLLPATIAVQEQAEVLKKKVEKLSVSIKHHSDYIAQSRENTGGFPGVSLQGDADSLDAYLNQLILLINHKGRDN